MTPARPCVYTDPMKVYIYKPAKNAMQSGRARIDGWVLEYEPSSRRKPEPLMGWTSSEDTLNQVKLLFPSDRNAVAYAEKRGWDYTLSRPKVRKVRPRNYADNFRYVPPKDLAQS